MTQLSDFDLDIQTKLLRATFLNNMAVLRKHMPEIFEFYQNYTPTRTKLTFDHNGEVNMIDDGSLVYEEHAKENSYKQAELFVKEPRLFSYSLNFGDNNINFEHERVLQKLYKKREEEVQKTGFNIFDVEKNVDLLTMIGVGLGFHIERIFQLCDVRLFYLYEPDPDCFYCALHCIDFGPLIEHCFARGGAFTIRLGGNANQYVNGLNAVLIEQGYFNIARFYNYRHYRSKATDETFQKIYELAYRLSNGWGFFEDEIISVIHTLSNAKESFPFLKNNKSFENPLEGRPVFIIGNGPSFDETIEYLRSNVVNAVVFSCGSALKSILDAGIIPDFHIEMERTAALYKWVDSVGHKETLKKINIITLNTVFTDILKLFKNAYILPKPKDGGMDFLYEFLDEEKYPPVYSCNPTVTNAATAAAIYMGFKELYLFGVDYGYIDEERHHSQGSLYYQKGSHVEQKKMSGDMKVAGNFVDTVFTKHHFDNSRASLEILLEQRPEITCYNCSNGAKIHLTKSIRCEDLDAFSEIEDKKEAIIKLLSIGFSFTGLEGINLKKEFENKLVLLKEAITNIITITSEEIHSRRELTQILSKQYKYTKALKDHGDTQVIYRFLQGTVNYFQSNIMTNVYCYQDTVEQKKYINHSLEVYHNHLNWLYDELASSYNQRAKI